MKPSAFIAAFNRLPLWRRHVRVWDLRMSAPTFDRCLYLWMHRLGRMGREDRAWLERAIQPGAHVADVGANIGLYTLLLARLTGPAGRVYAFEPDPLMGQALRANLATHGAGHIELFPFAAGAATGHAVLQRNAVNSGDNRLGAATGTGWHASQESVPVRPLDEMLAGRRVDFIKMDVQGWEAEVLRGASALLEANPGLRIYFEFWPHGLERAGTSVPQLASLLRDLRLNVTQPDDPAPADLARLAASLAPRGYANLLATR